MPYKWLLFDLDGTLFDYDRAEQNALRRAFEQMGVPYQESYLPIYHEINHRLWLDFEKGAIDQAKLRLQRFELLFEAIDARCDLPALSANYLIHLANSGFLMADAEDTVKTLHGQVDLAAITNGLTDVQGPRLARSSLGGYFKAVIISEEVGSAKPSPEIFDTAFARMGHPARGEVLIVGDSLTSDIQGGHDYGIDTCWFNPSGMAHDGVPSTFEIRRLAELIQIVQNV
jgi:2-haloacid dehalogenase